MGSSGELVVLLNAAQDSKKASLRNESLLHFVAFFHVASLLFTGVDNEKVGVDNEQDRRYSDPKARNG